MASFYERQVLDNMEDELPLDLNPRVPTRLPITDSFLRPQLASLKAPNSNTHPLTPSPPDPVSTKLFPKSLIPPRPKPPIPSEYFVYPKRSWRSMSKEQVRTHILDRYGAKQRYITAYKEWEDKHNKWVFGAYHLVRAVTKAKRREMKAGAAEMGAEEPQEQSNDDVQEAGDGTAPTDVIGDLDVDFETALTTLQEGAEVDELDRVKRWWMQAIHRNRPQKRNECSSTPVLPILSRQGDGAFGPGGLGSRERHTTPDIDLPHQAVRKIHSSMSSCIPPQLLSGQGEFSMSDSDDDDEEEEENSPPSWRIYSDRCACGYAGCHCRSWARWWNKTFQMLQYAEYVDLPASTSGVSGVPEPGDELLGGPVLRYARVRVGKRYELVKHEPPVRSLHKPKSPKSKKRAWSFKDLMKRNPNHRPTYCSRVTVPARQRPSQDGTAGALSQQSSPKHIFLMRWEDFFQINPKVPGEYLQASTRIIYNKAWLCKLPSVVASPQWPSRIRALQCIAYIHYTYRLPSELFLLAVNVLDRFATSYPQIARLNGAQWDLVGFASLWLAWKYENHTSVPRLDDLITHPEIPRFTRDQIIHAEWTIRNTIGLNVSHPSPLVTMRLALVPCQASRETKYLARFLVDISSTVYHLVIHPSSRIGVVIAWLACVLTDVSLHDDTNSFINGDKAANYKVAAHLLMGVLNIPRPIEKPREQALFYKWTLPIVNNIAGWCQQTLDSVWPNRTIDDTVSRFSECLLELQVVVRSQPFKLGAGPSPQHALFEE